ncbi:MAG TPA: hypothetical protein VFV65_03135 [Gemmatimonadales bacterium]|nr:hypothetical protein [Gemmatimonadales bacterium]
MTQPNLRTLLALAAAAPALVGPLVGQGSLNPTVAPRAAELARNGQRGIGTEMLSRYLATSPDDGAAWIQLGRFYLLDIRDWHLSGHPAESPGPLYIDFGAAALDQAVRLRGDSGVILRQMLEVERAQDAVERQGYGVLRQWTVPADVAPLPDFIVELGANLLGSCPASGVMATGSDLETVAMFSVLATAGQAGSVVLVVPAYYATDARYRYVIASALGTDSSWSVQQTLTTVAQRRPVCLTPLADRALLALPDLRPMRFVLVTGPGQTTSDRVVTVTDLARADRQGRSAWLHEVHSIYAAAAGFNPQLCTGPLALLGDTQIAACRR